jgi:hypothetical protein
MRSGGYFVWTFNAVKKSKVIGARLTTREPGLASRLCLLFSPRSVMPSLLLRAREYAPCRFSAAGSVGLEPCRKTDQTDMTPNENERVRKAFALGSVSSVLFSLVCPIFPRRASGAVRRTPRGICFKIFVGHYKSKFCSPECAQRRSGGPSTHFRAKLRHV